jgi:hypothetical protein
MDKPARKKVSAAPRKRAAGVDLEKALAGYSSARKAQILTATTQAGVKPDDPLWPVIVAIAAAPAEVIAMKRVVADEIRSLKSLVSLAVYLGIGTLAVSLITVLLIFQ